MALLHIDGSHGEGGGQVLRTSLALSLITGRPFRIDRIRAGRPKPGLMRQHLTAVKAAAEVGGAEVEGASVGSTEISFRPQTPRSGCFHFSVGTAGSCTLVLQTVLPALMVAEGESELVLEGGTHNPFAPPYGFLDKAFAPLLGRLGPGIAVRLERAGFYPAGGGRMVVNIRPAARLTPMELLERGPIRRKIVRGIVARLPKRIAAAEAASVCEFLDWDRDCCLVEQADGSYGPGNILTIEVESEHATEVITGFGQRGVRAEEVGRTAAQAAKEYLDSGAPVGPHLADQLMIPLAMAGKGAYRTMPLSRHSTTNIDVIRRFLDLDVTVREVGENIRDVVFG